MVCAGCDRLHQGAFCPSCVEAVAWTRPPVCRRCGLPDFSGECRHCRARRPAFAVARSAALYEEPLARAVRELKYRGREGAAVPLGDLLAEGPGRWPELLPVDLLVPLPIHPARERRRGYNQSLLLARRVSERLGIALRDDLLARPVHRPAQARLSRADRLENVRGAFRVTSPSETEGRRILLVDDVMTTGATADEAARCLLAAGARRVAVLTLAREM